MVETHAWNEKLDVAHEAMDHEHHLQIALLSGFAEAVEQRRPWLARRLAEQLVRYSVAHFGSEELLMEASGYGAREVHAREHETFLERMRELGDAYDGAGGEAALAAALELRGALAAHIDGADRGLADHVRPRRR